MESKFYVKAKTKVGKNLLGEGLALCLGIKHNGNEPIFICVSNGTPQGSGAYEKGEIVEVKSFAIVYVKELEGEKCESKVAENSDLETTLGEIQKTLESQKKEIHGLKSTIGKLKTTTGGKDE